MAAADIKLSVEIDAARAKTGADRTKKELDGIRDSAKKSGGALSSINSVDFKALGGRLKEIGGTMQSIGSQMQGFGVSLSAAITLPLTALATLGVRSALSLDAVRTKITALVGDSEKANAKIAELRDLANRSVGVTQSSAFESFAQLKGIGDIADDSINKIIASIGKLNAAFKIDDQDAFIRNLNQIFTQSFERADIKEAIGRVPIFEQLLEQAFGTRDGDALRKLKESGAITLEGFLTGISDAINTDPRIANISENLTTKIAKGAERINVALAPLGDAILKFIVPVFERSAPLIESLGNQFAALSPEIQTAIVVIGALAAGIGPALVIIGTLIASIGGLVAAIGAIVAAGPVVGIVIAAIVGLLGQIVIAAAAAGVGIAILWAAWQTNFGGIRDLTAQVTEFIKAAWDIALVKIRELTDQVLAEVAVFWNENGEDIMAVLRDVSEFVRSIWEAIAQFLRDNSTEINAIFSTSWNLIKGIVIGTIKIIADVIKFTLALIKGDWQGAWNALVDISHITLNVIVAALKAGGALLLFETKALFQGIWDLATWVTQQALALGNAIVEGLIQGLKLGIKPLTTAARALVETPLKIFRSVLDIRSPSHETEEIGRNIAEGMALGIGAGEPDVFGAAKSLSQQTLDVFRNGIGRAFDIFTDTGRSFREKLGDVFSGIAGDFKNLIDGMVSQILGGKFASVFGGGAGGGGILGSIFNPGGTPGFNPNAGAGGGLTTAAGGVNNSILLPNGQRVTVPGGRTSGGQAAGAIGTIASLGVIAGGLIGGRVGGAISRTAQGALIGLQFGGPIGAGIGAAVGFISGLFGGNAKEKRDKKEKLPQLEKGFIDAMAALRSLVGDVRSLRVAPDEGIAQATQIRNQISSGFGIQFESKKFKKQAAGLIAARVREADTLISELRGVADIARAASDRERRIIPEFASGVFTSSGFIRQLNEFKRRNGLLGGSFALGDRLPSLLSGNEMVLNPRQQSNVRQNAGFDVFRGAGIPGVSAGSGSAATQAVASREPINLTLVFEHSIDAQGLVQTQIKNSADVKNEIRVVIEDKFANGGLDLKRRGR